MGARRPARSAEQLRRENAMVTIDALKAYGANTDEGVARCVNNEAFYLRMVGMALEDKNFDALRDAMAAGDARKAFEAAHALKGAIGNVSLTPIYDPVCKLTELLRGRDAVAEGGDALLGEILAQLDRARAL